MNNGGCLRHTMWHQNKNIKKRKEPTQLLEEHFFLIDYGQNQTCQNHTCQTGVKSMMPTDDGVNKPLKNISVDKLFMFNSVHSQKRTPNRQ